MSSRRSAITFTRLSPGADRAGVVGRARGNAARHSDSGHVYTDARRKLLRHFRLRFDTFRFALFTRGGPFYWVILFFFGKKSSRKVLLCWLVTNIIKINTYIKLLIKHVCIFKIA